MLDGTYKEPGKKYKPIILELLENTSSFPTEPVALRQFRLDASLAKNFYTYASQKELVLVMKSKGFNSFKECINRQIIMYEYLKAKNIKFVIKADCKLFTRNKKIILMPVKGRKETRN